jgi:hypothetical protein
MLKAAVLKPVPDVANYLTLVVTKLCQVYRVLIAIRGW